MGAPPKARTGETGSSVGRPIVAGVGPFVRPLSPRVTLTDLWGSVEAIALRGEVTGRPGGSRERVDKATLDRYQAFVNQAQQYYATLGNLEPAAKPLTGYYFALNLSKAFLVMRANLPVGKVYHGLADAYEAKSKYYFSQEQTMVHSAGVFRWLAEATGMGYCWPNRTKIRIADLLPHLVDAADLYADNTGNLPQLLEVEGIDVLFDRSQAWLKVDVARTTLRRRKDVGPQALISRARIFGDDFRLVQDGSDETASYESKDAISFGGGRSNSLPDLCQLFDRSLLVRRRGWQGGQTYIELSDRPQLLSQEAVIYLVLHHLSNMVRYRPEQVEKLRGSPHFWLFSSWVDRACENFLLSLASRITFEEHVIL